MIRLAFIQIFVAIALPCAFIGCGPSGPKAAVKGMVKLDGAPLAAAEVRFVPKGSNPDLGTAVATTTADGAFTIKPDSQSNNLLRPGRYIVLVAKVVSTEPGGAMGTPTVNLVPAEYSLQDQTPLDVELKNGDNTLPPFEILSPKK
jgi:hypothetical protein